MLVFVCLRMKSKTEGTVLSGRKRNGSSSRWCRSSLFSTASNAVLPALQSKKIARAAIDSAFADRLADGTLSFRIIDISKPENEAIAEKYQVTWSSLYIVSHKNGQEKAENMTEFAFSNARKSPGEFKKGLVDKINEMIN